MVKILETIPQKKAQTILVPKGKPVISGSPGSEDIIYRKFIIPGSLNRRFLQKCGIGIKADDDSLTPNQVESIVRQANNDKNIYLRFAGARPLSVVTDQFSEISPRQIAKRAYGLIGTEPLVRYFRNDESLQLNFPVSSRFKGLYLTVNTGPYGVYGGSGMNAVKVGIAWYNKVCSNWTLFLDSVLRKGLKRTIHKGAMDLDRTVEETLDLVGEIGVRIGESKGKLFSYGELDRYLIQYEARGLNKKIANQIREDNKGGVSAYDLSYRLTELCQDDKLSDVSRANMEFLAGEVILCYDQIKKGLPDQDSVQVRRSRIISPNDPGYVRILPSSSAYN